MTDASCGYCTHFRLVAHELNPSKALVGCLKSIFSDSWRNQNELIVLMEMARNCPEYEASDESQQEWARRRREETRL